MPIELESAEFLTTATRRAEWPRGQEPEVAFVGRSNVGKSSLLNALAHKKGLARVSATPGRTRALQFFDVVYRPSPAARPRRARFCDLPGYGYAEVSRTERERWASMIEDYLRNREVLVAVVLIVDARHPPAESDTEALAFVRNTGREVVVAATKIDKLPRAKRPLSVSRTVASLGLKSGDVVPFSAVEGMGADALLARLSALLEAWRPPSAGNG